MKTISQNKFLALLRLFKYVEIKKAIFYLKQKISGNHFVPITFKDGSHTNSLSAALLNFLPSRTDIISQKEGLFLWKIKGENWIANYDQIVGLVEYASGETHKFYSANYENKIVLDIGGFIGDTAKFFIKKGAKRVVIFEPSEKNYQAMKLNLKEDLKTVTIFKKALNFSDEDLILFSNTVEGGNTFGLSVGSNQLTCEGIKIESILAQEKIDIAKVDCEGGEKHLLLADEKVLQKVNYWIIETHDLDIHKNIIQKFSGCGFNKLKQFNVTDGVHVIHFNRYA